MPYLGMACSVDNRPDNPNEERYRGHLCAGPEQLMLPGL
jgi:hypothetical protein